MIFFKRILGASLLLMGTNFYINAGPFDFLNKSGNTVTSFFSGRTGGAQQPEPVTAPVANQPDLKNQAKPKTEVDEEEALNKGFCFTSFSELEPAQPIPQAQEQAKQFNPVTVHVVKQHIPPVVGTCAHQGGRDHMEDTNADFIDDAIFAYGVFDGHGGDLVSKFAEKRMLDLIVTRFKGDDLDKKRAIAEAYKDFDRALKLHFQDQVNLLYFCGSTAVAAVIDRAASKLLVSHVGDSRIVVYRGDGTIVATQDHTPELEVEKERIIGAGGGLQWLKGCYRVCIPGSVGRGWGPTINMSRCLGDFALKDYGVIGTPDVQEVKLAPDDKFMILASDGFWDFFTNTGAVEYVNNLMQSNKISPQSILSSQAKQIAEAMVEETKRRADLKKMKMDNITVKIVFFPTRSKTAAPALSVLRDENMQGVSYSQKEPERKRAKADFFLDYDVPKMQQQLKRLERYSEGMAKERQEALRIGSSDELDHQLQAQLDKTSQDIQKLKENFPQNPHIQLIALVINKWIENYKCMKQYENGQYKKTPFYYQSFEFADFCSDVIEILDLWVPILEGKSYLPHQMDLPLDQQRELNQSVDHLARWIVQKNELTSVPIVLETIFKMSLPDLCERKLYPDPESQEISALLGIIKDSAEKTYCDIRDARVVAGWLYDCAQKMYNSGDRRDYYVSCFFRLVLDSFTMTFAFGLDSSDRRTNILNIIDLMRNCKFFTEGSVVEIVGLIKKMIKKNDPIE